MCTDRCNSETSKLEELSPLVCATDVNSQEKNESTPGEGLVPTPEHSWELVASSPQCWQRHKWNLQGQYQALWLISQIMINAKTKERGRVSVQEKQPSTTLIIPKSLCCNWLIWTTFPNWINFFGVVTIKLVIKCWKKLILICLMHDLLCIC